MTITYLTINGTSNIITTVSHITSIKNVMHVIYDNNTKIIRVMSRHLISITP